MRPPPAIPRTPSVASLRSTRSARSIRSTRTARSARSTRSTRAARAARARQAAARLAARNKPLPPLPLSTPARAYAPLPEAQPPPVPPGPGAGSVRLYIRTDAFGPTSAQPDQNHGMVIVADLFPNAAQPSIYLQMPAPGSALSHIQPPPTLATAVPHAPAQPQPAPAQELAPAEEPEPARDPAPHAEHGGGPEPASSNHHRSLSAASAKTTGSYDEASTHIMQATKLVRAPISATQLPHLTTIPGEDEVQSLSQQMPAHLMSGPESDLSEQPRPDSQLDPQRHTPSLKSASTESLPAARPHLSSPPVEHAVPPATEQQDEVEELTSRAPTHPVVNPDTVLGRMLSHGVAGPTPIAIPRRSSAPGLASGPRASAEVNMPGSAPPTSPSVDSHARNQSLPTSDLSLSHHKQGSTSTQGSSSVTTPDLTQGRMNLPPQVHVEASTPRTAEGPGVGRVLSTLRNEKRSLEGMMSILLDKRTVPTSLGDLPNRSASRKFRKPKGKEDPWVEEKPKTLKRTKSTKSLGGMKRDQLLGVPLPSGIPPKAGKNDSAAVAALLELLDRQTGAVNALQAGYAEAQEVLVKDMKVLQKSLQEAQGAAAQAKAQLNQERLRADAHAGAAMGLQEELDAARADALQARAESLKSKALLHEAQQSAAQANERAQAAEAQVAELRAMVTQLRRTQAETAPGVPLAPEPWEEKDEAIEEAKRPRPTLATRLVSLQEQHQPDIEQIKSQHDAELARAREARSTKSRLPLRSPPEGEELEARHPKQISRIPSIIETPIDLEPPGPRGLPLRASSATPSDRSGGMFSAVSSPVSDIGMCSTSPLGVRPRSAEPRMPGRSPRRKESCGSDRSRRSNESGRRPRTKRSYALGAPLSQEGPSSATDEHFSAPQTTTPLVDDGNSSFLSCGPGSHSPDHDEWDRGEPDVPVDSPHQAVSVHKLGSRSSSLLSVRAAAGAQGQHGPLMQITAPSSTSLPEGSDHPHRPLAQSIPIDQESADEADLTHSSPVLRDTTFSPTLSPLKTATVIAPAAPELHEGVAPAPVADLDLIRLSDRSSWDTMSKGHTHGRGSLGASSFTHSDGTSTYEPAGSLTAVSALSPWSGDHYISSPTQDRSPQGSRPSTDRSLASIAATFGVRRSGSNNSCDRGDSFDVPRDSGQYSPTSSLGSPTQLQTVTSRVAFPSSQAVPSPVPEQDEDEQRTGIDLDRASPSLASGSKPPRLPSPPPSTTTLSSDRSGRPRGRSTASHSSASPTPPPRRPPPSGPLPPPPSPLK